MLYLTFLKIKNIYFLKGIAEKIHDSLENVEVDSSLDMNSPGLFKMCEGLKIFAPLHKYSFFTDQLITINDNGELSSRETELIKFFLQHGIFI